VGVGVADIDAVLARLDIAKNRTAAILIGGGNDDVGKLDDTGTHG
jgi:hypothetical protein